MIVRLNKGGRTISSKGGEGGRARERERERERERDESISTGGAWCVTQLEMNE